MVDRMKTLRAPHPLALFVVIFIALFTVQLVTWSQTYPFDEEHWIEASQLMSEGILVPTDHLTYGYPGTPVTGITAGFLLLGIDGATALRLAITLLFSLGGAGAVVAAYLLRPRQAWWPLLAWALFFQHSVYFATPPSSVLGPILTLFALLILFAHERRTHSLGILALIGVAGGLAIVTRLDIGGLFVGSGILALSLMTRSLRVFVLTSLIALAAFIAFNPYLWTDAVSYFAATIEKISAHATPENNHGGALRAMLVASFVGTLSLVFLALAPLLKLPLTLSRGFLLWFSGASALILGALFISAHHPTWIFYPILLPLELFFPLFVMSAVPHIATRIKLNPAVLSALLLGIFFTYYAISYHLLLQ